MVDFVKVDNQSIVTIGTSYEKMFPESDYFTQLDINSEKLNETLKPQLNNSNESM